MAPSPPSINFDVPRSICSSGKGMLRGLGKSSQVYLAHVCLGIIILYFATVLPYTRGTESIVDFSKKNAGRTVMNLGLLAGCVALLAQLRFPNVVKDAQECARPADRSIVWSDGTTLWYREGLFFTLFLLSLVFGLCTFAPGTILHFDPASVLPGKEASAAAHGVLRALCVVPIVAFGFYIYKVLVKKMELVKPVQSRMYFWERPLAGYFSAAFLFVLPYLIRPRFFVDRNGGGMGTLRPFEKVLRVWKKIATFRVVPAISLFAALYVVVWRLQGGLFLGASRAKELRRSIARATLKTD